MGYSHLYHRIKPATLVALMWEERLVQGAHAAFTFTNGRCTRGVSFTHWMLDSAYQTRRGIDVGESSITLVAFWYPLLVKPCV